MSVLRASTLPAGLVLLLAVVAACGGGASPGVASNPAGSTPGAPSDSAPPTGDAAASRVSPSPFVRVTYARGTLQVEISGDVTATRDLPIEAGLSTIEATIVSYADPSTGEGGMIAISSEGNVVTISTAAVSTVGANFEVGGTPAGCTITVSHSDGSSLAGTFDCKRLAGVIPATTKNVTVDMRGTFEASR